MATLWCIGCGDLGTGIGAALAADGWNVIGVRRHPAAESPFPQVALDVLANPEGLKALPAPDFVVYTVTPSQRTEAAYQAAYVEGVRQVLSVLSAPLRRFVLVSSTGVYHQSQGEWVDETTAAIPQGFSGKALLDGETLVRHSGLPATVVRLSGIYGPGRHRLIERARSQQPAVRHPPAWTNRIHRDDAVGFVAHLLRQCHAGLPLHDLYLGTDDVPATEWDVMCAVHELLDLPPPAEKAGSDDQNKRLRNTRLQQSGYVLRFPGYREGYADMIRRLSTR
jgi:nucleoside-diphosphate-sugar epimerase